MPPPDAHPSQNAPAPSAASHPDPMARLRAIMARLRDPVSGCPWDLEQTWATIAPYTIEEAYEVADAIDTADFDALRGELGDLLLQVVYYTQMGTEQNRFTFDDVATAICDKMIARHPHVFGPDRPQKSADQQTRDWEAIKAAERARLPGTAADPAPPVGTLDGIAANLPALTRAFKLQNRAARVGFDWPQTLQVLDKLTEEATELTQAAETLSADRIEDEIGDLLFVMANLARHLGANPEAALRRTNAKFTRRFAAIEAGLRARGQPIDTATLDEMEALWQAAKAAETPTD